MTFCTLEYHKSFENLEPTTLYEIEKDLFSSEGFRHLQKYQIIELLSKGKNFKIIIERFGFKTFYFGFYVEDGDKLRSIDSSILKWIDEKKDFIYFINLDVLFDDDYDFDCNSKIEVLNKGFQVTIKSEEEDLTEEMIYDMRRFIESNVLEKIWNHTLSMLENHNDYNLSVEFVKDRIYYLSFNPKINDVYKRFYGIFLCLTNGGDKYYVFMEEINQLNFENIRNKNH